MKIRLIPVRSDSRPEFKIKKDILIIDGEEFDFSVIPDGATLPAENVDSEWIIGNVERIDGELNLSIALSHGANAPEETRFPKPLTISKDGVVDLPIFDTPVEEFLDE